MRIRDAREDDIEAILAIYNDAVANTTAIWNERIVDAADRLAWLAAHRDQGYPVLVAVDGDDLALGYATFGDWRAFDGYRHTVEHSVYVRRDKRGAGIGTALMRQLIERARALGKHVMVAAIEADNTGSIQLHEALGFEHAGRLREVGAKFGRWLDLAFMTVHLDERSEPCGPPSVAAPVSR
jgi:L-amino acid N-acyltransferase